MLKLLHAADFDLEAAQRGILYIDEIDKIGKTSQNVSITRDVSGEGVQQALLRCSKGQSPMFRRKGDASTPSSSTFRWTRPTSSSSAEGRLSASKRSSASGSGSKMIGFGQDRMSTKNQPRRVCSHKSRVDDILQFGLIPELVGRLPVICTLAPLSEQDLVRILNEPKNSLVRQYEKFFEMENAKLEFTEDALREIARIATHKETGARGLRSVIESVMFDIMFELPDQKKEGRYVITGEVVRGEKRLFAEGESAAA